MLRTVLQMVGVLAIAYVALGLLLFLIQDFLIFYPQNERNLRLPPNVDRFEIEINSHPKRVSRGYILNREVLGPVVVFFAGNASESGSYIDAFQQLETTVIMTNYRGFGGSDGNPSESAILKDAQVQMRWVKREFPERPIVLMGFSLGSGVAMLSSNSEIEGLVLVSPYRSLVHVAKQSIPGLFPLDLMMRTRLDSSNHVEDLPEKILVLYSRRDTTIPANETLKLLELVPQALVIESSVQHNQLLGQKSNLKTISNWLQTEF